MNYKIIGKYIKDLSFSIPNSKTFFLLSKEIILIKVPNEIYDELRKIFISLFENSGFKDIKLGEKVNFEELFKSRKTQ